MSYWKILRGPLLTIAAALLAAASFLIAQASVQAAGTTVTILHSFGDDTVQNDGSSPWASLIQATDGNFYGTTTTGGAAGGGTIFEYAPATGAVTILHSFGANCLLPQAALIQASDGNFYGTTPGSTASVGGTTLAGLPAGLLYGTIFEYAPATGAFTVLHSFNDGSVRNDGQSPQAALIQALDGNFYGTTEGGGSANDGTLFEYAPATRTVTILHSFGDGSVQNDGIDPSTALVQSAEDGCIYGTTESTIFKYAPSTGKVTTLQSFGGYDGWGPPLSFFQGSHENFFGAGGNTIFEYAAANGAYSILFGNIDGGICTGLIQAKDGNFYGTAPFGGTVSDGAIFEYSPATGAYADLHSFRDGSVGNDGNFPQAALVQASDGNFYGTTALGGSAGGGTIFEMSVTPPGITFPAGLQMMSLPYSYSGSSQSALDGLFGYSGVNLAVWFPSTGSYTETTDSTSNVADGIYLGHSYWVRFPQAVTISSPGSLAPVNQSFNIELQPGWNMIADPFFASVPVSSLTFDDGEQTLSAATSGNNPIIGPTLWKYSPGGSGAYVAATTLDPEAGYWIYAYTYANVQIPPP